MPTLDRSMLHPGNADYPRVERALNENEWVREWRVEEVMDFDGRFGRWFEGRFAIERRFNYKRHVDDGKPPLPFGAQFEPEIHVEVKARTYEQVVEIFWNVLESTKAARSRDLETIDAQELTDLGHHPQWRDCESGHPGRTHAEWLVSDE